jgi:hypothetical protein
MTKDSRDFVSRMAHYCWWGESPNNIRAVFNNHFCSISPDHKDKEEARELLRKKIAQKDLDPNQFL